uniref:Uncharacterized protein n=1 Tax=viral metagenome TaxID=1070528 RepID=A0A6M3IGY9_9ZZZZ
MTYEIQHQWERHERIIEIPVDMRVMPCPLKRSNHVAAALRERLQAEGFDAKTCLLTYMGSKANGEGPTVRCYRYRLAKSWKSEDRARVGRPRGSRDRVRRARKGGAEA